MPETPALVLALALEAAVWMGKCHPLPATGGRTPSRLLHVLHPGGMVTDIALYAQLFVCSCASSCTSSDPFSFLQFIVQLPNAWCCSLLTFPALRSGATLVPVRLVRAQVEAFQQAPSQEAVLLF